ncbi:MAG: magnesium and cobalt transport protein CorA, partial [Anaerolineae bacterium]|nr:magnesium and cobalt transport protein CorA [Anaerolineae bacterium]
RPKVEAYSDHIFAVVRAVRTETDVLFSAHQVALFIGNGFVISVRDERYGQFEPVRDRLRVSRGRIRYRGADYLGYALIDSIVDHYLPVVDHVTERIEALADDLLGPSTESLVAQVQSARRALGRLRRLSMPLKDVVEQLQREPAVISDETRLFLRDCADNALTILDSVEQLCEMATHVMDAHMALVN